MSAINTYNDHSFTGKDSFSDHHVAGSKVFSMPFNSSDLDMSNAPATMVLGYLLALVSATVMLLTGEPPWFLLTVVVALGVAFFLPRGLDITRSK